MLKLHIHTLHNVAIGSITTARTLVWLGSTRGASFNMCNENRCIRFKKCAFYISVKRTLSTNTYEFVADEKPLSFMTSQRAKQKRFSVNANSAELGSLLHDNSRVCSRTYQSGAPRYVIFWKPQQIRLWISYFLLQIYASLNQRWL